MKTLVFLLLCNLGYAQSVKLELQVARIPVTENTPHSTGKEKVLLVFEGNNIGLVTSLDTLELIPTKLYLWESVYKDIRHNDQYYHVMIITTRKSFAIFITPIKPFKRRLWAINLHSI